MLLLAKKSLAASHHQHKRVGQKWNERFRAGQSSCPSPSRKRRFYWTFHFITLHFIAVHCHETVTFRTSMHPHSCTCIFYLWYEVCNVYKCVLQDYAHTFMRLHSFSNILFVVLQVTLELSPPRKEYPQFRKQQRRSNQEAMQVSCECLDDIFVPLCLVPRVPGSLPHITAHASSSSNHLHAETRVSLEFHQHGCSDEAESM